MNYPLSEILRDVRVALRQNHDCQSLIDEADVETLTLNEFITAMIEPVAEDVIHQAPLADLDEGQPFSGPISWDHAPGRGAGVIILPSDFLRVVTFRMSGWRQPATLIDATSSRASWQFAPFAGVHGNPCRPVALIQPSPVGRQLHFFSSYDGHRAHIVEARYLPVPRLTTLAIPATPTSERWLTLPSLLYHPLIRALTAKVNESLNERNPHNMNNIHDNFWPFL